MSRLKLPIIIALVLAAAGAGLFLSGLVGDSGPKKKYVVEPISLTPPDGSFVVNLADTDATALLSINVAVELEPMDEEHWLAFSGGDGGHGAKDAPGPLKVATYPKFHDAVLTVASSFPSSTLLTEDGKNQFKKRLLTRFDEIAERDTADFKVSANSGDSAHVGPPYHVLDVQFTKYAIQISS